MGERDPKQIESEAVKLQFEMRGLKLAVGDQVLFNHPESGHTMRGSVDSFLFWPKDEPAVAVKLLGHPAMPRDLVLTLENALEHLTKVDPTTLH